MSTLSNSRISFKAPLLVLSISVGAVLLFLASTTTTLTLFSFLVILASGWLMHRGVGAFNPRAMTIPAFWYFTYVAIVATSSFFVYADQIEPYRTTYLVSVESVLITVPLGILLMNRLLGFQKQEIGAYFEKPVAPARASVKISGVFLIFAFLAIGLALRHMSEVGNVPLLYLLKNPGDYFQVVELREEAGKLLNSPLRYAYAVLQAMGFPMLIMIAYGRLLSTRQKKWLVYFVGILIFGTFYVGMTTEKLPVAAVLLMLIIFHYLWRRGSLNWKSLVVTPLLFLAYPLFVVVTATQGMGPGFLENLSLIGERIFYTPAEVLYYYFEVFPDKIPFQHGATIGKFAVLMGERTFDSANFVGLYMDPTAMASVNANAAFIGNLHADFGLIGVLIGGVLAGMAMQAYQVYVFRTPKTAINLALYAFGMFHFALISMSPLPVVLLSDGIIFALLFAWALEGLEVAISKPVSHQIHSRYPEGSSGARGTSINPLTGKSFHAEDAR